jgi:hypothetical protein
MFREWMEIVYQKMHLNVHSVEEETRGVQEKDGLVYEV